MLRKLALVAGLGLGLALIAIPGWIALNRRDLPGPGDADLLALSARAGTGQDGYGALREAGELVRLPEDFEARLHALDSDPKPIDPRWLAALSDENASAFRAAEVALGAPRLRLPEDPMGSWELLPTLSRLAKLSRAEARLLFAAGSTERAFDRALWGLRVGQALASAENSDLISTMTGVGLQSASLGAVERLAREGALDIHSARSLIARIDAFSLEPAVWEQMWAGEYRRAKSIFEDALVAPTSADCGEDLICQALELLPDDYLIHPNRTLSMLAEHYRHLQKGSTLPCSASLPGYGASLATSKWRLILGPNPSGNVLVAISAPNSERFQMKRCHLEARIAIVQTSIAMHSYRAERGTLPARLADLVPHYLDGIPVDAFDGRPLRYAPEDGIVYSIGEDFEDPGPPAVPSLGEVSAPAIGADGNPPVSPSA